MLGNVIQYLGLVIVVLCGVVLTKIFLLANVYVLASLRRIRPPYRVNFDVVKKNVGFYLGSDVKARMEAARATYRIFSKQQEYSELDKIAKQYRQSWIRLGLGIGIMLLAIIMANGQEGPLTIAELAVITYLLWVIIK